VTLLTVKPLVPLKVVFPDIVITLAVSVMPGVNFVVTEAAGVLVLSGKVIPALPPAVMVIYIP
jgi:hypothetical protein